MSNRIHRPCSLTTAPARLLRRGPAAVLLALALVLGCASQAMATIVIGHRGDPAKAPEATIRSFSAAKHAGANYIEADIQWTSDGGMVALHDYGSTALNRTTDCTGSVQDKPLAQVLRCRTADGQHIPTFQKMAAWAEANGARIMPEIRDPGIPPYRARQFMAVLHHYRLSSRAVVQSANPRTVSWIAARYSTPMAYVTWHHLVTAHYLASISATYYVVDTGTITARQVAQLQAAGRRVLIYVGGHTVAEDQAILAKRPYGIFTDNTALTRQVLAR